MSPYLLLRAARRRACHRERNLNVAVHAAAERKGLRLQARAAASRSTVELPSAAASSATDKEASSAPVQTPKALGHTMPGKSFDCMLIVTPSRASFTPSPHAHL